MKFLVTGATGFIGQHLVRRILAENYPVRALCRATSPRPEDWAQRVEWTTGDVTAPETLPAAVRDADVIFHLAGAIRAPDFADFTRVNITGTRNLLEAVINHGKKDARFIYISSLSASGPSAHWSPKTEEEPCYPVSDYGQSKLEAEIEVLKHRNKLWCAIIRPAVVYGPGDRESLIFFKIAQSHLNPQIGLTKRFVSLIYISDLVDLLWAAAQSGNPSGEIYFASDEQSDGYEWNQIIASAAHAMNFRLFKVYLPNFTLAAMLLPAAIIAKITGRPGSFNRDKYREMSQMYWTCSSAKARKQLDFKPVVELEEGLRRACHWYKEQKWI
jgi:nucleoside-diphosphate-sugar epimerase